MAARLETYPENTTILKEGQLSKKMYMVLEGSVILYLNYGLPDEYVLGVCGKGKVFGEMGMLAKEPSLYTAVSFTDVKLAWFEERNLDIFIKGYPDRAIGIMKSITRSNRLLRENLIMTLSEIEQYKAQGSLFSKTSLNPFLQNPRFTSSDSSDQPETETARGDETASYLDQRMHKILEKKQWLQ